MKPARKTLYEPFRSQDKFTLFDLESVRLILRGGSVLDWHRLNLSKEEITALLRVHRLDLSDPDELTMVIRIRDEAVVYLREVLSFPIPKPLREASLPELLDMAGDKGNRHRQFCACVLLKAMHTINHFDASEARQALAMADQELFKDAERRVYRAISHMMANDMHVVEFIGGRKQRSSSITKLLSKKTPLSAQLFDKMRFRIITSSRDDVPPIINYLARNLFPFNYALSGESYNTLIPFADYCSRYPHLHRLAKDLQLDPETENRLQSIANNQHSSPEYKVVHWVADMPLKVPNYKKAFHTDGVHPVPRPVVYIRTEIQILDRKAHRINESSNAAHEKYKERQIGSVISRLKLGLADGSNSK
jgi:uncharacterized protein (TIGR04552 family)